MYERVGIMMRWSHSSGTFEFSLSFVGGVRHAETFFFFLFPLLHKMVLFSGWDLFLTITGAAQTPPRSGRTIQTRQTRQSSTLLEASGLRNDRLIGLITT